MVKKEPVYIFVQDFIQKINGNYVEQKIRQHVLQVVRESMQIKSKFSKK